MFPKRSLWMFGGIVVLAAAVSCSGMFNPASRLHGKWLLDAEATLDNAAAGNAMQRNLLAATWSMAGGNLTLEFFSDGSAVFTGASVLGQTVERGKWKLTHSDGDALTVDFTGDENGQTREFQIRMIDDASFTVNVNIGQVQTAVFRKAAAG